MPVFTADLRLQDSCYPRHVAEQHIGVIEEKTADVDSRHDPVPVDTLDEKLESDDMDKKCECEAACEPMRVGEATAVNRPDESLRF